MLGDIYLGKITKWNDPAIAAVNPGVPLPDSAIAVVRRADGSGTSFLFTNYLSKVNSGLESKSGRRHRGELADRCRRQGQRRRVGIRAASAQFDRLRRVRLFEAEQDVVRAIAQPGRRFVSPSDDSFKAAAVGAEWSKSFNQVLTEQAGKDAWPITGATFIMMHAKQDKPQQAAAVLKFFDWAYKNGDKMADELDYVPMPDAVEGIIRAQWGKITDVAGKAVLN